MTEKYLIQKKAAKNVQIKGGEIKQTYKCILPATNVFWLKNL